jgi:hypothetical protein
MCKGFTAASVASTGGGNLKLLSARFFPLSFSTDSWRITGNVSFLAPSNLVKVEYNCVKINGSRDERDASGECGGDTEP